jgi:hypothetical protein
VIETALNEEMADLYSADQVKRAEVEAANARAGGF